MRPKLVGPTTRQTRPDVLAAVDSLMERATARGIGFAVARMLNRPDATADLAAFRGPVSVVVGEEDTLTPPAEAAAMAAVVPGAALVTIPRAGHLANLESPGRLQRGACGAGLTPSLALREAVWHRDAACPEPRVPSPESRVTDHGPRTDRQESPSSPARAAAWDWPAPRRSPGKAAGSRCAPARAGRLAEAAAEVGAACGDPARVFAVQADVATAEGVAALVDQTVARFGGLDILVNNVGLARGGDLLATTDADWQEAIDQTLMPAFARRSWPCPHMKRRGGGVILMIASIFGRETGGRMTYNAVKAAEISLAKSLAQQLARDNIRVNSIAPGLDPLPRRVVVEAPAGRSGGHRRVRAPRAAVRPLRHARRSRRSVVAFLASPQGQLGERRQHRRRRLPVAVADLKGPDDRATRLRGRRLHVRPRGAPAAADRRTSSSAAARPGSTPRRTTARCCATCGPRCPSWASTTARR